MHEGGKQLATLQDKYALELILPLNARSFKSISLEGPFDVQVQLSRVPVCYKYNSGRYADQSRMGEGEDRKARLGDDIRNHRE